MAFSNETANPVNDCNDCIVRSTAKVFNEDWQSVMRKFCDKAIEMYLMPNDGRVAQEVLANYPVQATYLRHDERLTVHQLAESNPSGKFIALTKGVQSHAIGIVNGDWFDIYDSGDEELEYYWTVEE
jgi:hypothetical protein